MGRMMDGGIGWLLCYGTLVKQDGAVLSTLGRYPETLLEMIE